MIKQILILLSVVFTSAAMAADLPRTPSTDGAEVYIVSPADGAKVGTTFDVVFGLKGMGVAPAGIDMPNTGHHHLLLNSDELPPMTVPMGTQVAHFGGGQTQTTLTLEPGKHTLQLILGDKLHIPHDPPVISKQITITVE
ncbi:MAG: DUF4399 domain-containing protein [Pseudomonadota bacterium]